MAKPGNPQGLAALFSKLQHLESAGLPIQQAVSLLQQENPDPALTSLKRHLKSGKTFARAGLLCGILDETEMHFLQAAEVSGNLAQAFGVLASRNSALAERIRKVKSRLLLPGFVLLLSFLTGPLPSLVAGKIDAIHYLAFVSEKLALAFGAPYLLYRMKIFDLVRQHSGLFVPLLSSWIARRERRDFLQSLAMMLGAGLAFSQALPVAVESMKNRAMKKRFEPALRSSGSGRSVADTLERTSVIPEELLQIARSAEAAGRLAPELQRLAQNEEEDISRSDDQLATWLPRIAYTLVAIWTARSLLGSHIGSM